MNTNSISAFEYVTILISIILGLGITQVLSSAAEAFYHSKKIKFFLPHTIWVLVILFLHIQDWFILYELKEYPVGKLSTFLFIILYPIVLFVITKLLFPPISGEENINLKDFFLDSFPKIFYLFCVCILLSVIFNMCLLNASLIEQTLLFIPFVIFSTAAFRKIKNVAVHYSLAIFIFLLITITTIAEHNNWYVK